MNLRRIEWKNTVYIFVITLPLVLIDQVTKVWAETLKKGNEIVVFESWWNFTYVENRGAFWGFGGNFPEILRKFLLLGLSSVFAIIILFLLLSYADNKLIKTSFGFVLAGAVGNLYDRFFKGFVVTDFIQWHIGDLFYWPTFNIADVAIVIGAGLLIIHMILLEKKNNKRAQ